MSSPYTLRFEDKEQALAFYKELTTKLNSSNIAGLDEVGKGALSGPVIVACVVLPPNHGIVGIRDSKKIGAKKRHRLAREIVGAALSVGIGGSAPGEVDRLNVFNATHAAAVRAAQRCLSAVYPVHLLCDGGLDIRDHIACSSNSVIKGDDLFECIGAASIVAKVYRDTLMAFYHEAYPEYGFNTNSGYGTAQHRAAIEKYGITSIHRRSFGICRVATIRGETDAAEKFGTNLGDLKKKHGSK